MMKFGDKIEDVDQELHAWLGDGVIKWVLHKDSAFINIIAPAMFPNGDHYTIYLFSTPGGLELRDTAQTYSEIWMSYGSDVFDNVIHSGCQTGMERTLKMIGVSLKDGEIYVGTKYDTIERDIFKMIQGIAIVYATGHKCWMFNCENQTMKN